MESKLAGPNDRHSSQSFRNLWGKYLLIIVFECIFYMFCHIYALNSRRISTIEQMTHVTLEPDFLRYEFLSSEFL